MLLETLRHVVRELFTVKSAAIKILTFSGIMIQVGKAKIDI